MKIKERDYNKILDLVEDVLGEVRRTFALDFGVSDIYLYGSQLTESESPGDVDVYVLANSVSIVSEIGFVQAYGEYPQGLEEGVLVEIIHDWLHQNQIQYQGCPIDINFSTDEFPQEFGNRVQLL